MTKIGLTAAKKRSLGGKPGLLLITNLVTYLFYIAEKITDKRRTVENVFVMYKMSSECWKRRNIIIHLFSTHQFNVLISICTILIYIYIYIIVKSVCMLLTLIKK